jgi:hypothetical protein
MNYKIPQGQQFQLSQPFATELNVRRYQNQQQLMNP